MRTVRSLGSIVGAVLGMVGFAQPGSPDVNFTLVIDTKGTPMPGIYAEDVITRHDLARQGVGSWSVEEHFTNADPNMSGRFGEHTWWMLKGTPLSGSGKRRSQFRFMDCMCTEHFVRVQRGAESMRIDLPDAPAERWALVQHVMQRSGDIASPEVVRFRPGRFAFSELMNDTVFDELEVRLAKRLRGAADAFYKKQIRDLEEYYRNQPPPTPPAAPYIPPPPMPTEQWEAELARQPGLKKVEVDRMSADTVWVRITGRVMLDGGCASGMPLFGVEMLTDSGWVQRIPFELIQMDCGMPWADWHQRVVMIPPLQWWVGAHQPEGKKELVPGSYRLSFIGGNGKQLWTDAFTIPGR